MFIPSGSTYGDVDSQIALKADTSYVNAQLGLKQNVLVVNDAGVKTALNATGTAPIYACRAWVNFNGTGTVAIRASGNVSSITDNGVGDYTINFTTAMPDVNYNTVGTCGTIVSYSTNIFHSPHYVTPNTTSATRCLTYTAGVNTLDMTNISASVFR